MTPAPIDRELLDAFIPEFTEGLARLTAADGAPAAGRVLDGLRAMASAMGLTPLEPGLEAAAAAADPFDAPALRAAAGRLRQALNQLAEPAAPAPVTVLVVDDSPTMRRIIRGILAGDADFAVVAEAADGVEALAALREHDPALILLDLEMPVLDGFGFLRHWALSGRGPVVVVSSAVPPGSQQALALRRLGVAAVVGKPTGALSFDLADKRGAAVLAAARRAAGLAA
ncbi:response regulator [Roseomonas marmotae]|uniref:Response regulator n=1 Tax=Roseomonas marmotae TaxID=2768161 RepID=A0ABS3KAB2_9PROT|nr:response regulator [Roseomonas marmotae]MBO1073296.1 response regulator [Roseomonas marmotae]QTI79086.1 response regulator [Roseomonas marmotae]